MQTKSILLNFTGDTVRISGKRFGNEAGYEYKKIYMCGDVLTSFINRYGVKKIIGNVRMKLKVVAYG